MPIYYKFNFINSAWNKRHYHHYSIDVMLSQDLRTAWHLTFVRRSALIQKSAVYSCVALRTHFPVLHHQPKRCDFTAIEWWEQKADTCACLLILFFSACRVCPRLFRVSPGREVEIYEVLTTTCNVYSRRSRQKNGFLLQIRSQGDNSSHSS